MLLCIHIFVNLYFSNLRSIEYSKLLLVYLRLLKLSIFHTVKIEYPKHSFCVLIIMIAIEDFWLTKSLLFYPNSLLQSIYRLGNTLLHWYIFNEPLQLIMLNWSLVCLISWYQILIKWNLKCPIILLCCPNWHLQMIILSLGRNLHYIYFSYDP